MNTRVHPTAKIKGLPEEAQAELWRRIHEPKATAKKVLAWLAAEFGVQSSEPAFSYWCNWYQARLEMAEDQARCEAHMEEQRQQCPEKSEAEIFAEGQRFFSLLAIARRDSKMWTNVQKAERDRESSRLDSKRFQRETGELFLKWMDDARAKEIAARTLPHAEKVQAICDLIFEGTEGAAPT